MFTFVAGAVVPAFSQSSPPRAEVLVLGVYHMANPGHDLFNTKADDVLAPKRQAEIAEVIAALKIAGVVERIGDYAKNIARRVRRLPKKSQAIEPLSLLPEMAGIAGAMVNDVLVAFVERDPHKAVAVCKRDDALDDFYESIFRTLLTYMMEDPQNIGPSTTLLFVAKNLERIGDHATNIAEMVYYAATGERLAEPGN